MIIVIAFLWNFHWGVYYWDAWMGIITNEFFINT